MRWRHRLSLQVCDEWPSEAQLPMGTPAESIIDEGTGFCSTATSRTPKPKLSEA